MAKIFSDLVAALPHEAQEEIRVRTKVMTAAIKLDEIRKAREISQSSLASTMGVSQPAVSKMENGTNMTIKTLSAFASGLGGRVRIEIEFPEGVSYKVL